MFYCVWRRPIDASKHIKSFIPQNVLFFCTLMKNTFFIISRFSKNQPLGRFFHRGTMSVDLSVPCSCNFLARTPPPLNIFFFTDKSCNLSKIVSVLLSAEILCLPNAGFFTPQFVDILQ